jgi:hypothetical protein
MEILAETTQHAVTYEGGLLFITDKVTKEDKVVKLKNVRGQCITRGQFKSSCEAAGPEKAISVFLKLAARTPNDK